jgi:hypothetical protein
MSDPMSRATSGVFIRPVWRRVPGRVEIAVAMLLAMLPLAGLVGLTLKVGQLAHRDGWTLARVRSVMKRAEGQAGPRPKSPAALALAAVTSPGPKPRTRTGTEPAPGSAPDSSSGKPDDQARPAELSALDSYALGREMFTVGMAIGARSLRAGMQQADWQAWVEAAILLLLGAAFCFFGWPLRRAAAALLGAYAFGRVAFGVALVHGMNPAGALVVALAPAFLGALLGWHLVVAYTTVLSGMVLGTTIGLLILVRFGEPSWLPGAIMILLLSTLATIFVYLLALRPALISGWAVLGAGLTSLALVTGAACVLKGMPLWDLFLCLFALMVVLGTVTQYRFAVRRTDLAAEAAATPDGQKMLRRLRREAGEID